MIWTSPTGLPALLARVVFKLKTNVIAPRMKTIAAFHEISEYSPSLSFAMSSGLPRFVGEEACVKLFE